MTTNLCLSVIFIHELISIQADQTCSYYNNSSLVYINCEEKCCSGMATSPSTACCSSLSWSTLAIPISIVAGFFLFGVFLVYSKAIFKICFCEYSCPCNNRSRVTSANDTIAHDNPIVIMNNRDLPDYETIIKDSRVKDSTPPPYNFVTTHPTDFGIETRVPSAPPQYRSRSNSIAPNGLVPIAV